MIGDTASDADSAALRGEIHAFNFAATGYHDGAALSCFLRDGAELVAGIDGFTWGGYARIDYLWVSRGAPRARARLPLARRGRGRGAAARMRHDRARHAFVPGARPIPRPRLHRDRDHARHAAWILADTVPEAALTTSRNETASDAAADVRRARAGSLGRRAGAGAWRAATTRWCGRSRSRPAISTPRSSRGARRCPARSRSGTSSSPTCSRSATRSRASAPGDRVIVPFQVSCGACELCRRGLTASCATAGAGAAYGMAPIARREWGGALSDCVRVPYADAMLVALPAGLDPGVGGERLRQRSRRLARGRARRSIAGPGAPVLVVGGAGDVALYAVAVAVALGQRAGRLRRHRRAPARGGRTARRERRSSARSTGAGSAGTRSRSITAARSRACRARCDRPSPRARARRPRSTSRRRPRSRSSRCTHAASCSAPAASTRAPRSRMCSI